MRKEKNIYIIKTVLIILLFLGAVTFLIDVVFRELNTIPMGNITSTELNVMYHVGIITSILVLGVAVLISMLVRTFITLIQWENTIDYVDIYPSEEIKEVSYPLDDERHQS